MTLPDAVAILQRAHEPDTAAQAEAAAEFLAAAYPHDGRLLHAAGQRLLEVGLFASAVQCLEAAAAAAAKPEVWNDLGVARQRLNDNAGGIAAYRRAIALRSDYVKALANLAAAFYLEGRDAEALEPALAALALQPEDPGALVAAIAVLRRGGRPAEALPLAERLCRVAPQADADEWLGLCLRDLGRHDAALAAYDRAIERTTGASALANRADVLLDLGRFDEAVEALERALATDPRCVAAWAGMSQIRAFTPDDPGIATMEAVLAESPPADQRVQLHFVLGRAYASAGIDDRSFDHFGRGNALHRRTIVYDVAADEARAAAIIATVDAGTLARLAGGFPGPAPIFVVGMPRSGTTLVEQILASLPNVVGAGELDVAATLLEPGPYPANVPALDAAAVAALGARYAEVTAALAPAGARIVDKMPANIFYAGLLHAMLPDARIVLCRRDPLDTGLSLYTHVFSGRQLFAYDQREIGRYMRAQADVVAHWRATLPPHAFHQIEYEAIVTDFEPTVRRLLAFCGLPWDDACLRFHQTERVIATASRAEVRRPIYRTSIGSGRRAAPYLGPLIEELGGLASAVSAAPPG